MEEQIEFNLNPSEELTVYQDNLLVFANYDMSAMEQKLLLIMLSTINKNDICVKTTSFRVVDLAQLMNVSSQVLYRDLKKICKSIMSRVVEIQKPNGDWDIFNIISLAKYKNKQGIVEITLNKQAEPYLLQLKELFTSFKLNNTINLDSKYAIRIYQQTKSYSYKKEYYTSIDNLKNQLKLTQKSYKNYGTLKSRVIDVAVKEINQKTDINLTYEEVKKVRKVIGLKFTIRNKQKVIVNVANNNINNKKNSSFNNFEGRNYTDEDYAKMEEKLLFNH